jgi:hypothetical protein
MRCCDDSKMGSVMVDRCVERGPERRFRRSPQLPDSACPVRYRKVGRPYHFPAVAASSEATLRTRNAAVTKNSTVMGRGFRSLAAGRACAGAHVTTMLRSLVTRAACWRGTSRVRAGLSRVSALTLPMRRDRPTLATPILARIAVIAPQSSQTACSSAQACGGHTHRSERVRWRYAHRLVQRFDR